MKASKFIKKVNKSIKLLGSIDSIVDKHNLYSYIDIAFTLWCIALFEDKLV